MFDSTLAIGFAATKPILFDLGREAGRDAVHVMRLIEVAEIGAGVLRVLVLVPERRRVAELHVRIFLGEVDDEGRVIAERGREDQARAVEVDHQFHRLRDRVGLGHVLLLDHLDARHFLQRLDRDRVRLVPAEIVARADVDDADREVLGGEGAPERAEISVAPANAEAVVLSSVRREMSVTDIVTSSCVASVDAEAAPYPVLTVCKVRAVAAAVVARCVHRGPRLHLSAPRPIVGRRAPSFSPAPDESRPRQRVADRRRSPCLSLALGIAAARAGSPRTREPLDDRNDRIARRRSCRREAARPRRSKRPTPASRAHDDPALFIALDRKPRRSRRRAPQAARGRRQAALWRSLRRQGQYRRRRPADDRGLPGFRLSARRVRLSSSSGSSAPARSSSARPISTSSRPGSSACARPTAFRAMRCAPISFPAVELGLGDRGRRRARPVLARHRHGGIGARARGAQRHRRAEAFARRAVGLRRRPGLPHARHVSIFALDVADAFAVFRERAAPSTRPTPIRGRFRGRRCRRLPRGLPARRAPPRPAPVLRRRRGGGRLRARPRRARSARRDIVEFDFEPFAEVARLLYEGPWVAERYAATKPLIETRSRSARIR